MVVVARQIWFQRNDFVFGNKISSAITTVGSLGESLEVYQVANARKGAATKTNTNDLRWEAPKNDFVKIN